MPREIPECPNKPNPNEEAGRGFEIQLITPMFGGGVEPRINDPSFPIRPSTIRGQLQFWWRATVGAQCTTVAELRAAQSAVWGSTKHASCVQVLVENVRADDPVPCAKYKTRNDGKLQLNWNIPFPAQQNALPYALFPFQGQLSKDRKQIEEQPASYIETAHFRLILRCPKEMWAQVEPAVWAWANFGGMGGRTRRGCGAIRCKELAPRDHAHLAEQIKLFSPQQSEVREWPTIVESILLRTVDPPDDPFRVWDRLIGLFKHFRQGPGFARNHGQQPNRPGRSRWPEPETIRETLGADRRRSGHQRLRDIPADAFPRAEFGLPIIYELRGEGEPPKSSLQPIVGGKPADRMASPLILKPLALSNGQALPVIVRLVGPQVNEVVLMQGKYEQARFGGNAIRGSRLATTGDHPMSHAANGSALDAFLAFARSEEFTEVTR
jgi:CRISPR-associated protein Cmr1